MALKETVPAFQHSEQMCPNWQNISKSCSLQRAGCTASNTASNRLPGALAILGLLPEGLRSGLLVGQDSPTNLATKGRDTQAYRIYGKN